MAKVKRSFWSETFKRYRDDETITFAVGKESKINHTWTACRCKFLSVEPLTLQLPFFPTPSPWHRRQVFFFFFFFHWLGLKCSLLFAIIATKSSVETGLMKSCFILWRSFDAYKELEKTTKMYHRRKTHVQSIVSLITPILFNNIFYTIIGHLHILYYK